jgi:hypothetical protein
VIESQVNKIFRQAYNKEGYFVVAIIISRLKRYYWLNILQDIKAYIEEYL